MLISPTGFCLYNYPFAWQPLSFHSSQSLSGSFIYFDPQPRDAAAQLPSKVWFSLMTSSTCSDWCLFHYFLASMCLVLNFFLGFLKGLIFHCAASAWKPWRPGRLWNWSRWWELAGVSQVYGRSQAYIEVALAFTFGRYSWPRVLVVVFIIVGFWNVW